ncbi:MAG: hypothetical protein JST87_01335 [Bacteroidetes bacterium]|nr:hypothetical protein [Bacteroidota bacterium]
MATYLLLRDNKQSGPYTFDEIKAKGFKAYDLVWIEGKSAAWRYPGEIEEFKLIAPPVEEQPFDRFYKKPAQNHSTSTTSSVIQDHIADTHPADKIIREINTNASDPNKKIYVNLPAAQKNNFVPEKKEISKNRVEEQEKKEAEIKQIIPPVIKESPKQNPFFSEEDNIRDKQSYVSKTTYREAAPKTENASTNRKEYINKYFFSIVSAVLLLVSGIAIGLLINRNSANNIDKNKLDIISNNPSSVTQNDNNITSVPVSNPVAGQAQPTVKKDTVASIIGAKSREEKKNIAADNASKKKTTDKDKTDVVQQLSAPPAAPVNIDSSNPSYFPKREAIHRSDVAADKDNNGNAHTTSLVNLVSVTTNKYNVGTFGGISDLQLTINNQSSHALDLVVVEVQYIQANKKVYKTENINFRNISAGASLTEVAPSTSRGIKVQYRITVINTKEQGLSYSAL